MSQRNRGISLPELSILSFDPTEEISADKKKGATDEAGRPKDNVMQTYSTDNSIPQSLADVITVGRDPDIAEREYKKAYEWLEPRFARGKKEIFSEAATITPSMAEVLLKGNPDNRNVKKARLAEIKADLENGNWVFNGESVIISRDGLLNDGQHRLMAVRDTGVSMKTLIVFGVARSSRITLDQGTARTSADYLNMQGRADEAPVVACVARMIWQYQKLGGFRDGASSNNKSRKRVWPTKSEIVGVAMDNERDILRSAAIVGKNSKLVGSQSFVAFCHWLICKIDDVAATQFVERLVDGANLSPESPIYVLRQRLITEPRMKPNVRLEAVIRAWNATRRGKTLSKIQIMGSVPKIEA